MASADREARVSDRAARCEVIAELARRMLLEGVVTVESVTVHLKDGRPGNDVEVVEIPGQRTPENRDAAERVYRLLREVMFSAVTATGHIEADVATGAVRIKRRVRELTAAG